MAEVKFKESKSSQGREGHMLCSKTQAREGRDSLMVRGSNGGSSVGCVENSSQQALG